MSLTIRKPWLPASEPLPPSPFERGRLIAWDDLESATEKYTSSITGAGTAARSTDTAKFGSFGLKCVTDVVPTDHVEINYRRTSFHDGFLAPQMCFASADDIYELVWDGAVWDGTNAHHATMKWTEATEKLSYMDSDGVYQDLPGTYPFYAHIQSWATLKVVLDTVNKKYVSASFMDHWVDLSDYDLYTYTSAIKPLFVSTFRLTTAEAAAKTGYFDNYRLTEDEQA